MHEKAKFACFIKCNRKSEIQICSNKHETGLVFNNLIYLTSLLVVLEKVVETRVKKVLIKKLLTSYARKRTKGQECTCSKW